MSWVDPDPLLPGGLPDEQLDGAADWSSLWDQSSRACGQMSAKILIALNSRGARDFFYFLRSTATLSPKKVMQQARKEPVVQLHIPPGLNFYRVHPRFYFLSSSYNDSYAVLRYFSKTYFNNNLNEIKTGMYSIKVQGRRYVKLGNRLLSGLLHYFFRR